MFKVDDRTLGVTFPKDYATIDRLKAHVDGRKWNPKERRWEVPYHMAPRLVDRVFGGPNAVELDNTAAAAYYGEKARREALDETRAKSDTSLEIPELLCPLLNYQRVGVEFGLRAKGRVGIYDPTGLGKTPQALALALALPAKRVLVLTLAALTANWRREVMKFTGLEACVWNTQGARGPRDARFHIVSYDTLLLRPTIRFRNAKRKNQCQHVGSDGTGCDERVVTRGHPVVPMYCGTHETQYGRRTVEDFSGAVYYELLRQGFDMVIADECHVLSNRDSLRSQAVYGAVRSQDKALYPGIQTPYVCELTATALQNRPAELFPLIQWIDESRFPSFFSYANKYGAWKDSGAWTGQNRPTKPQHLDDLHDRIKDIVIRREKRAVLAELPPCREEEFVVELSPTERRAYERLLHEVLGEWKSTRRPSLVEMGRIEDFLREVKLPAAVHLLTEHIAEGRAAILFSTRLAPLKHVQQLFGDRAVYIDGSMTAEQRLEAVDAIQEGRADLLCSGLVSGGVGLNVTRADLAISLDMSWNPQHHVQALGRMDRIGQENPSRMLYLVAEDTTDEIKRHLLAEKLMTAEAVLDGTVTSKQRPKTMFKDFVRRLKRSYRALDGIDDPPTDAVDLEAV